MSVREDSAWRMHVPPPSPLQLVRSLPWSKWRRVPISSSPACARSTHEVPLSYRAIVDLVDTYIISQVGLAVEVVYQVKDSLDKGVCGFRFG